MSIINKNNFAVILRNALEYYDFMLYGFFAAILAPLFFRAIIQASQLL